MEKKVEKQGKWGIMKTENAVNTVVEPYLLEIETAWLVLVVLVIVLNRTYERLKLKLLLCKSVSA